MAKLFQKGDALDYTNGTADVIPAGKVIVAGTFVGVAQNDIPVGALGAIAITGVWIVPVGSGVTFTQGAPVYWSASNGYATATASDTYMGRAAYAAGEGATEVYVRLEAGGDAGYANAG